MTETVLRTERLAKAFGALQANDAVSIDLRKGEIHALIGPNGAGKSTLLDLIAGNTRPDSGRIELLGRDASSLSATHRARLGLGRTFQVSSLALEFSVLQNAVLGALGRSGGAFALVRPAMRNGALLAQARQALQHVGLQERTSRRASELSHGERRRLEVAVTLAREPRLFLMDEPMAGLGAEGSLELVAVLDSLREQAPILLVEHDMDAVFALADRISVLDGGAVIATGTVDEIRRHPAVRHAYLGVEDA